MQLWSTIGARNTTLHTSFWVFTCDNFVYVILELYIMIIVRAILLRSYYRVECGCEKLL
ncbi:hypothetical protein AMTRI_Chr03g50820 [Amborella trichopoda]